MRKLTEENIRYQHSFFQAPWTATRKKGPYFFSKSPETPKRKIYPPPLKSFLSFSKSPELIGCVIESCSLKWVLYKWNLAWCRCDMMWYRRNMVLCECDAISKWFEVILCDWYTIMWVWRNYCHNYVWLMCHNVGVTWVACNSMEWCKCEVAVK